MVEALNCLYEFSYLMFSNQSKQNESQGNVTDNIEKKIKTE